MVHLRVGEVTPAFVSGLEAWGSGVHAANATDVFDGVPQTVYSDSCCHYNQLGNELLADFIADRMLALIADRDPPPGSPPGR